MYEEEGESERSQQWRPQIGGKCERDFIGYSNSYQNVRHLTHTLLPHTTNQIIRTSDIRHLRPCTLSTNLYIGNPEPKPQKHKDYARKIVV